MFNPHNNCSNASVNLQMNDTIRIILQNVCIVTYVVFYTLFFFLSLSLLHLIDPPNHHFYLHGIINFASIEFQFRSSRMISFFFPRILISRKILHVSLLSSRKRRHFHFTMLKFRKKKKRILSTSMYFTNFCCKSYLSNNWD